MHKLSVLRRHHQHGRRIEQLGTRLLVDETERHNRRMRRDRHEHRPGEHELNARAFAIDERLEVAQQRLAPFVGIDAAEIQHVRPAHGRRHRRHVAAGSRRGRLESGADHARGRKRAARASAHEVRFLRRQKDVAPGQREELAERAKPDDRIFLCCRHQNRAVANSPDAEVRGVITVGPEQHAVVLVPVRLQVSDQSGNQRSVLTKPGRLVVRRGASARDDVVQFGEIVRVAGTLDGEAEDPDAADGSRSRRISVLPGQVVRGAAGQHGDVVSRRQPFGNAAAVRFRSADDVEAVALDHAGQLHATPDPRDVVPLFAASSSIRSRADSIASACSAAKSMRLICAWRRKLSMLYS